MDREKIGGCWRQGREVWVKCIKSVKMYKFPTNRINKSWGYNVQHGEYS